MPTLKLQAKVGKSWSAAKLSPNRGSTVLTILLCILCRKIPGVGEYWSATEDSQFTSPRLWACSPWWSEVPWRRQRRDPAHSPGQWEETLWLCACYLVKCREGGGISHIVNTLQTGRPTRRKNLFLSFVLSFYLVFFYRSQQKLLGR